MAYRLSDSLLIDCFRRVDGSCGQAVAVSKTVGGAANSNTAVMALPGLCGAASRVVPWALSRTVGLLGYAARRPLRLGAPGDAVTPNETVLLNIIGALRIGDRDRAESAALWLVGAAHVDALLRALTPVADATR